MLAMTRDGRFTECRAKEIGNGRCTHIFHQRPNQSVRDFVKEANSYSNPHKPDVPLRFYRTPLTWEQKEELDPLIKQCRLADDKEYNIMWDVIHGREAKFNYEPNPKIEEYEKDFPGRMMEVFKAKVNTGLGEETVMFVLKSNGVLEGYSIKKILEKVPAKVSASIVKPSRLQALYKWCDIKVPEFIDIIVKENWENEKEEYMFSGKNNL